MAKITRVQKIAKANRLGKRKQEQKNRDTNKNFQTKENQGGLTFFEVLQEEKQKFEIDSNNKKSYFMKNTMSKEYWEELRGNRVSRVRVRGI